MKIVSSVILLVSSFGLYANVKYNSYEPYKVEKRILVLSIHLDAEMMALAKYKNLKSFCSNASYRHAIFELLDQIHEYHDMLEKDLKSTTFNHSRRTIERILKHMDHLDRKFNPDDFTSFFREQCSFQSKIEKYSDHYKAGFGTHSYGGRVYAQEVVMYRYLKRLTKRVNRIKRHVEHFYMRRKVWEHGSH
ncbi:MAG: hypothetical protein RLN88_11515 [Ekhidna sp.]|uniref:hypothetical protein n=1 Tax=Ekhidna sp. TaxID=2608089 RepID=UPI0032ECB615